MKSIQFKTQATLLISTVALLIASGCNNGRNLKSTVAGKSSSTLSTSTTSGNFLISSVQETTDISGKVIKITVQSQATPLTAPSACGVNGVDCSCSVRWEQRYNGGTDSVPRQPAEAVTAITATQITCRQPSDYQSETVVPTGTVATISIRRRADTSVRVSNDVTFAKGSGTLNTLNQTSPLTDIARYTCSDRYSRETAIFNAVTSETSTDGRTTTKLAHSTRFCVPGDTSATTGNCAYPTTPNAEVRESNQRNSYNFYTRSNNVSITSQTDKFTCPEITKGMESGTDYKFFPLDRSFALAGTSSADFFVPVEANVKVNGGPGDPSSTGLTCGNATSANPDNSATVVGCLGFAAKPDNKGRCPLVSVGGKMQPTYRLRKYFAVFPPSFKRDGTPTGASQSVDTAYILDRPIFNSSDAVVGAILGPKPCPFAYRDMNGVIDGTTSYFSTNDPKWTGRNLDGIKLPDATIAADSCVSTFPTYSNPFTNVAALQFSKVSAIDAYYIRPIQPWTLHYEEDTSFQACAPRPNVPMDPPVHMFASASGGAAYCSEVHPNSIAAIGGALSTVSGHTGHVVHEVSASNFSGSATPASLPLLAHKNFIEDALAKDPSFRCDVTTLASTQSVLAVGTTQGISACCSAGANNHFEPGSSAPFCKLIVNVISDAHAPCQAGQSACANLR